MKGFDVLEKVGVSTESYCDAVKNALCDIQKHVHWFEVIEQRGKVNSDNKVEFQVILKIGIS